MLDYMEILPSGIQVEHISIKSRTSEYRRLDHYMD